MRGRIKKYYPGAVQHIYQRAADKGVVFYTVEDRLVYYTLASTKARKRGVTVVAVSIMFTHIHMSAIAYNLGMLRGFLHDVDTSFSRLYNFRYKRCGRLFEKPPGRSQKYSSKDIRSNLSYVFNNHVEKGLCKHAVEERWSLLAYALSDNPYSCPIKSNGSSRYLAKALRLVERRRAKCKALEYCDLDKILPFLDKKETEQFIDYVISKYALIDFQYGISHFGTIENMISAINTTTGGEYDISEDYTTDKDTGYLELINVMKGRCPVSDIFNMSGIDQMGTFMYARQRTAASDAQIRKFLHCGVLRSSAHPDKLCYSGQDASGRKQSD